MRDDAETEQGEMIVQRTETLLRHMFPSHSQWSSQNNTKFLLSLHPFLLTHSLLHIHNTQHTLSISLSLFLSLCPCLSFSLFLSLFLSLSLSFSLLLSFFFHISLPQHVHKMLHYEEE